MTRQESVNDCFLRRKTCHRRHEAGAPLLGGLPPLTPSGRERRCWRRPVWQELASGPSKLTATPGAGARAVILLLPLIALALAGCGRSTVTTTTYVDRGNVREDIAIAIIDYVYAFAAADGKRACNSLTPDQQRAVLRGAHVKLPFLHAQSCADALTKVGRRLARPVRGWMLSTRVVGLRVVGSRAWATLLDGTTVIRLRQNGNGRWLIAGGLNLWTAHRRRDVGASAGYPGRA